MASKTTKKTARPRAAGSTTSAPTRQVTTLPDPVMGETFSADKLEVARKASKYNAVAERARALKSGACFEIDIPEGYDKPKYRDMIATAIRERIGPKTETGIRVVITRSGKVAIVRD